MLGARDRRRGMATVVRRWRAESAMTAGPMGRSVPVALVGDIGAFSPAAVARAAAVEVERCTRVSTSRIQATFRAESVLGSCTDGCWALRAATVGKGAVSIGDPLFPAAGSAWD